MKTRYSLNLKCGEIVKGKILEAPDENGVATIGLPNCTLTAEVLGDLQKGKEVMFLVIKTSPGIVLRVQNDKPDNWTIVV